MNDRLDDSIFGKDEEPVAAAALTRRALREQRPPRSRGPLRLLVLLLAVALVGGAAYLAFTKLRPGDADGNDYPGPGGEEARVIVKSGDSGAAIATSLRNADVVKSREAYLDAAKENNKAAGIQPGTYVLRKQMKASDVVTVLVDPKNRDVRRVTIPEGKRMTEIYALLSQGTGVPIADYETAAKKPETLGLPASAQGVLEGYLFPSTYDFEPGTSATTQLTTMVNKAVSVCASMGIEPARTHEVLTVASIIESEAGRAEDRPKISRVLANRLAAGKELQLDSTVAYATGKRVLATSDADRAVRSPYNTYLTKGLPPGPIGSPGKSSIQAAIQPADGPWMYFVAVNPQTGETAYAVDYANHQRNVAQWQAWCAANPGQCQAT